MLSRKRTILVNSFIVVIIMVLLFSSCSPSKTYHSDITATNTATKTPTTTPFPLPEITLNPGDFYFSIDGKQSFIFARNLAGYKPEHYFQLLALTQSGGSQLVRIQLDSMGTGMTKNGEIDESWARNWEQVFDKATENGIYVLPVFSGWFDWNAGEGFSTWKDNSFNAANGGPAENPTELLNKDSATQNIWLSWIGRLIERWQERKNILAWEIFSEVNLITGTTEAASVEFIENAAAIIRENDPQQRPITASLADIGEWSSFYKSPAIDFINTHPYPLSAQLDRVALERVQHLLIYKKPVIIGESGLNAESPEKYPPNSEIGVRHAIWAELVSGSANGRAIYWEDGFGIFFPSLDWPWVRKYAQLELPAAKFVQDVDFSRFAPLAVHFPAETKIWGAAIGNEKSVIGWFRDAKSEPPDWPLEPVISGQTVTITVPGSATEWKVDFYDTKTGTDIIGSATVTRKSSDITLALPDFKDDIAFKLTALDGVTSTPEISVTTDAIAGNWNGTISNSTGTFSTLLEISIQPDCETGKVCGTFSAPQLPCSGKLFLQEITDETFVFIEQNVTGAASCTSGGYEYLQPLTDGTLAYQFVFTPGSADTSNGILRRP